MTLKQAPVEFYEDAEGKWRWRYVAANGRIMADSGQGYAREETARAAAMIVVNRHICGPKCTT